MSRNPFQRRHIKFHLLSPRISQIPRSKLTRHQNSSAASCVVFDPRGSHQISMQACLLGSLLRGNKLIICNLLHSSYSSHGVVHPAARRPANTIAEIFS
ncbi:hypothetical protein D3Z53_02920 [Lachnospiraceae bacterium]|nr:hypothetical protein [Lachnospiraceae bacterium]